VANIHTLLDAEYSYRITYSIPTHVHRVWQVEPPNDMLAQLCLRAAMYGRLSMLRYLLLHSTEGADTSAAAAAALKGRFPQVCDVHSM
jgi:hypothetical protein